MLSKKTKYALKAMTVLARNHGKGPMLISTISEQENIPKKFLENILLELKNAGMLASKKGAGGGYYLLKPPDTIMLSDIIRLMGGPIALVPCVSLNFYEPCEECKDELTCGIRQVALRVRDASLEILAKTSIKDLAEKEDSLILMHKKTRSKTPTK